MAITNSSERVRDLRRNAEIQTSLYDESSLSQLAFVGEAGLIIIAFLKNPFILTGRFNLTQNNTLKLDLA